MAFLQDDHFDLFDYGFIRVEYNSLTVTPSVVCSPPNIEMNNNQDFIVVPIVRIAISTTIKFIFMYVWL